MSGLPGASSSGSQGSPSSLSSSSSSSSSFSSSSSSSSSSPSSPSSSPESAPSTEAPAPASSSASTSDNADANACHQQGTSSLDKGPVTSTSAPTSASSRLWSSWISPSSSASNAASSALEERKKRRPTFEDFRAQEPPQARLIRLRGLFDVLLDKDDESALAGGRAKEEWTRSAMRARYGAGGVYARGSLAKKGSSEVNPDIFSSQTTTSQLQSLPSATTPSSSGGGGGGGGGGSGTAPTPSPPRQSYAKELLAQCRECRAELERERAKVEAKERKLAEREAGANSSGSEWWNLARYYHRFGGSEDKEPASGLKATLVDLISLGTGSEESKEEESPSSLLSSVTSLFSSASPPSSTTDLHSDHEGEAGWIGSGVWGLSAVGQKQRQADRERDEKVGKGHVVEDDGGRRQRQIEWEGFLRYAEQKERELYKIFVELDRNGDMRLDVSEINTALDRAGIGLHRAALEDFIASLASSSKHQGEYPSSITFPQFRDYLLLLPRKPSVNEIYRFYQVRKAFGLFGSQGIFAEFSESWGKSERHGATAVSFDGEVSLAGEEKKKKSPIAPTTMTAAATTTTRNEPNASDDAVTPAKTQQQASQAPEEHEELEGEGEEEEDSDMIHGDVAIKFLLAGGIAGAVSRTATAPFDRLKIYLITSAQMPATQQVSASMAKTPVEASTKLASRGAGMLGQAIFALYKEGGGLKAFWIGNGLNCLKIFPESAIKFLSYEMSKRAFAKYVDGVSDSRDISGSSRFMSGGIGGITSQLAIYPIETLKTRLMSSQGGQKQGNQLLVATARDMWRNGGMRTYYRGLTAGLVGVFPYSAIDMSTFEGIKLFWIKYTGREEPSVLALLAFGSISGSVGATTVYPLNLVRTRLQAAGTPAHPQTYTGFADAFRKTYSHEGVVGFYRGLVPTLAKVVPAVSISYVVYERSKRHLGVQ
ncbi:mitochondrial carrier [Acaromyces ingoldii]|uniref:Mitochondrial carrier n=1 Tax=Acaromyces ingoldii TaxID=215250 RepID=A0A316YXV8_9BASI|nr:mitochondrial carrier [Acaromyces ingoldii]PWN93962.1 mitochondrial carrier [Acaromyces ingoldii]